LRRVNTRAAIRAFGLSRVIFGTALTLAPTQMTKMWLGRDSKRTGTQVITRSMGVRDAVIGFGLATAAAEGGATQTWLEAGIVSDLVDLAATLTAADKLPDTARKLLVPMAATGTLSGTALLIASR
jgi:hypothetical protein